VNDAPTFVKAPIRPSSQRAGADHHRLGGQHHGGGGETVNVDLHDGQRQVALFSCSAISSSTGTLTFTPAAGVLPWLNVTARSPTTAGRRTRVASSAQTFKIPLRRRRLSGRDVEQQPSLSGVPITLTATVGAVAPASAAD